MSRLDRVFHLDKAVLKPKFLAQALSQGLNPVSLCRMMSGCEIVNPEFARKMHRLFRNFTGYICIHLFRSRFLNVTLGSTRAPANTGDRLVSGTDKERLPVQRGAYPLRQSLRSQRR